MNSDQFIMRIALPTQDGVQNRLDLKFLQEANNISSIRMTNEFLSEITNYMREFGIEVTFENFEESV